jgi:hypothetical protein
VAQNVTNLRGIAMRTTTLVLLIILAICLIFAGRVWLHDHISINTFERQYQKTGTDADLVGLCIYLYSENEHAKLIEYIPLALQIEDLERSIVEWMESYKEKDGLNDWARAYKQVIYFAIKEDKFSVDTMKDLLLVRFLTAYLYEEEYVEYDRVFSDLYREWIAGFNEIFIYLGVEMARNSEEISKGAYIYCAESFKRVCPAEPRYPGTDIESLSEYSFNTMVQAAMHYYMDDIIMADEINEQANMAMARYLQEVRDFHEADQ